MSKRARPPPISIQVDPAELILHDGAFTVDSQLERDQVSFAEQMPATEIRKPEEEFALLNILAKMVAALNQLDPSKPEGIILLAMAKNFITPETTAELVSGNPITAQQPSEFKKAQFMQAVNALNQKYQNDPPKRDGVGCAVGAARNQPITGIDVFQVFRHLTEGMQISPEMWQMILQDLIKAVKLTKKDGDLMNHRMQGHAQPNLMDLANIVQEGVEVKPDGTMAARRVQVEVPITKPNETTGLLEMSRDFWLAFFKAGQDAKLRDDAQRETAELLRNVGMKYVKTGRNAAMATPVEARANRVLIRKLQQNPLIRADEAKMQALNKLLDADTKGRTLTPQELLAIFEALGRGVPMTPDMLRAILEFMVGQMRGIKSGQEIVGMENLMGGGEIDPVEAVRVMSKAHVQKPQETAACLELFTSFFIAMKAAKQDTALRERYQRLLAETLQNAGQVYGTPQQAKEVDADGFRMKILKLRSDPIVRADPAKMRAVEELAAAQATGKRLSQAQLLQIFQDLSRGMEMTPEMLRAILEHMCTQMRTLTPNEKAELQKRFRQNPAQDPTDFVDEAARMRQENAELAAQVQMVGCFQILPEGHPALAHRPLPKTTQSRELNMRAGPASVEWHRYKAVGIQPPEEEMARIVLVQSQLADVSKFDDEKTQKTLMIEATDAMSFRTLLEPSVMEKYKESLRGDSMAMSALQNLSQMGTVDDRQLGKKVDQLLTTLHIDRQKLRNVLQQMVRDRLMTNDDSKDIERRCELLMAAGGGKMKLSELQTMMKNKRR